MLQQNGCLQHWHNIFHFWWSGIRWQYSRQLYLHHRCCRCLWGHFSFVFPLANSFLLWFASWYQAGRNFPPKLFRTVQLKNWDCWLDIPESGLRRTLRIRDLNRWRFTPVAIKNCEDTGLVVVVGYVGIFHKLPPPAHTADCKIEARVAFSDGMFCFVRLGSDVSHS